MEYLAAKADNNAGQTLNAFPTETHFIITELVFVPLPEQRGGGGGGFMSSRSPPLLIHSIKLLLLVDELVLVQTALLQAQTMPCEAHDSDGIKIAECLWIEAFE